MSPTAISGYLYGTAYFRPPNSPRHEHREYLAKIRRELGFQVIRVRMQWNAIHRQLDRYELIGSTGAGSGTTSLRDTRAGDTRS